MNSRDRLSQNPIRQAIESELEVMLREDTGLRELKERRRAEEIQSKLAEEKPLEEILESLLKHSPALASLFLSGPRASNPFKTLNVAQKEVVFEGKAHPTYFKFKGKEYGKELVRECYLNQRCRIAFETDAVNDYFSRQVNKGTFSLFRVFEEHRSPASDYVGPILQNGIATLSMVLPTNVQVGDSLEFEAVVEDPTLLSSFENRFTLLVNPEVIHEPGKGTRRKPPTHDPGNEREIPAGISLPNIIPVYESDWDNQEPKFDKHSALRVRITDDSGSPNGAEDRQDVYDFLVNMDNVFLKSELKAAKDPIELVHKRWQYALVLLGLAILHDDKLREKAAKKSGLTESEAADEEGSERVETQIERLTTALAPVLLPMIESLGALDLEESVAMASTAEAL